MTVRKEFLVLLNYQLLDQREFPKLGLGDIEQQAMDNVTEDIEEITYAIPSDHKNYRKIKNMVYKLQRLLSEVGSMG